MVDDLAILAQMVWETTLEIIPPYLKYKETDRKIYEISDKIGVDKDGLRQRAASSIALKESHQIYIEWLRDCVSVLLTARSKVEGNKLIDHMKAVKIFFYRDPLWLKHLTIHISTIIAVFDARYHIIRGEHYRLLPVEEMWKKMYDKLTQG